MKETGELDTTATVTFNPRLSMRIKGVFCKRYVNKTVMFNGKLCKVVEYKPNNINLQLSK